MTDWTEVPDEELEEANKELKRRQTLVSLAYEQDTINKVYQQLSGVQSGDPWVQPIAGYDAYPLNAQVFHNGKNWSSTLSGNVWEPGVSGWREIGSDFPEWIQPTGAHDAYDAGDRVSHNDLFWVSTLDANVWEPGVSGWDEVANG